MFFKASEKPRKFNIDENAYFFIKSKISILVNSADNAVFLRSDQFILSKDQEDALLFIGELNGTPLYALELYELEQDKVLKMNTTLELVHKHPNEIMQSLHAEHVNNAFLRCNQLLNWDRTSKFCGGCGNTLVLSVSEFVKICSQCQHHSYPQYSLAILVLVLHENNLLFARSPHFKPGMYCPLAGFIEAGESAIEAVHREVKEEVDLKIKNVRYFGAAPWPFPNTFMMGFLADYESGSLKIDRKEIEDAKWFHYSKGPAVYPPSTTLSYKLMQAGAALCRVSDVKRRGIHRFFSTTRAPYAASIKIKD